MLKIMFPIFSLMKLNSQLKKAQKIYKHSWFSRQRAKNLFIGLLATLPFLLVLSLASFLLYKDPLFFKSLGQAKDALLNLEVTGIYKKFMFAFSNKETAHRLATLYPILMSGFFTTLILGFVVRVKHPLIEKTKQLYKDLQRSGVIEKEEKNRLVLYTPLGCLVDVKGSTPKAVKEDTRIWTGLNIKVKDFAEDPDKISLVFFKKTYELKDKYIYKIQ
jgi:hypothetical protein